MTPTSDLLTRNVLKAIDRFRATPGFQEAERQEVARIAKERQEQAKELAAVRKSREGPAVKKLGAAFEDAQAAEHAAKQHIADVLHMRVVAAQNALNAHTCEHDLKINRLETALAATAAPEIGEFIEWCFGEVDRTRRLPPSKWGATTNPITGKVRGGVSNRDRLYSRCDALMAAIDEASALRFGADVDPIAELARIRANLPEVDGSDPAPVAVESNGHASTELARVPTILEQIDGDLAAARVDALEA